MPVCLRSFELVVVALFTWLVHYGLSSFTRRKAANASPLPSWAFLLLLLTGVILVSAFQRLSLYRGSLRLYATGWWRIFS